MKSVMTKKLEHRPSLRIAWVTVNIGIAAGILALFAGVPNLIPIGREVLDQDSQPGSVLVLNPPEGGQPLVECKLGTLKVAVLPLTPIRTNPTDSSPAIGVAEQGQMVCTFDEQSPAGWRKVAVPTDITGTSQGWVKQEAFRMVRLTMGKQVATEISEATAESKAAQDLLVAQIKALQGESKVAQDLLVAQLEEMQGQSKTAQDLLVAQLKEVQGQSKAAQDLLAAQLKEVQGQSKAAQDQLAVIQKQLQTANQRVESLESSRTITTTLAILLAVVVGMAMLAGLGLGWRRWSAWQVLREPKTA